MNFIKIFLIVFALAELMACAPSAGGPHRVVVKGEAGSGGDPSVTGGTVGYDQLKPIFAICADCHHAGGQMPAWLEYEQAKAFATTRPDRMRQRVLEEKSMPPPGTPEAAKITDTQRAMIGAWIKAGAPEKSSAAAPPVVMSAPTAPVVITGPAVVQQCFACHGVDGLGSSQPQVPRLAGLPDAYIQEQLKAFKAKVRIDPSGIMNGMAAPLSDDDITTAAGYFSTQPAFITKAQQVDPTEDKMKLVYDTGRTKAEAFCVACHVHEGGMVIPGLAVPALFGQKHDYIFNELNLLKSKARVSAVMNGVASTLTDDEISGLALYFSTAK